MLPPIKVCYMPDTVSGAGDIAMSKAVKNPCPQGTYLLVGRQSVN